MSIYKCSVCGYIYDESKNDKLLKYIFKKR